jgi:hypothetical protein
MAYPTFIVFPKYRYISELQADTPDLCDDIQTLAEYIEILPGVVVGFKTEPEAPPTYFTRFEGYRSVSLMPIYATFKINTHLILVAHTRKADPITLKELKSIITFSENELSLQEKLQMYRPVNELVQSEPTHSYSKPSDSQLKTVQHTRPNSTIFTAILVGCTLLFLNICVRIYYSSPNEYLS